MAQVREPILDWSQDGQGPFWAMFDADDMLSVIVELLDDDYRYLAANKNTCDFHGRPEGGMAGLTARQLKFTESELQSRLEGLRETVAAGRTTSRQYAAPMPDGTVRWLQAWFSPVATPPGLPPRVACVTLDITQGKTAQILAETQSTRLRLALDVTALGLWEYDLQTDEVIWDARMRVLFGVAPDEPINFARYSACFAPGDFDAVQAAYLAALGGANGGDYQVEHRILHPDGSIRWGRGAGRVIFDAEGKPVRVIGTTQDITAEVEARERQALLLAELNHRVKNNMATVQAILAHTYRAARGDLDAFRDVFQERLFSLSRGHDLLTRNAWERAELGEAVDAALAPFRVGAIQLSGERGLVGLKPELAVSLVMILHELATNAAKYGALSQAAGRVDLSWGIEDGGLVLDWRESGGPRVNPPQRTGFGARLTASALKPFGGSSDTRFDPTGVQCRLRLPLGEAAALGRA